MRFFTFFAVSSAIAICSNAVSIEKRDSEGESACNSDLKAATFSLGQDLETFASLNWAFYLKDIELISDANAIEALERDLGRPSESCCKTLGSSPDLSSKVADSTFKDLGDQADSYVTVLTYIQKKKGEAEKRPDAINGVRRYLNTVHSGYTKLFECMHANAIGPFKPKLDELKNKISKVDTEVRKAYGI